MEKVTILPKNTEVTGDYDAEADCLYLTFGEPEKAVGHELTEEVMVIVRLNEQKKKVVGLTLIGIKAGIEEYLHDLEKDTVKKE